MLGGLGLALGTLGLAAVLLRNVIERRGELALLLAVGYRPGDLVAMVLAENVFLLVVGLASGTVSALAAMLPHIVARGDQLPFASIAATLAIVFATGMASSVAAVYAATRTPLVPALRAD
jgi:ABC-type antimicrobial peptide transport system permease subunit